jgi:hypothetical protein
MNNPEKSLSQNVPSSCETSSENNVFESDEEQTIVNGVKTQSSGVESLFDGSGDVSAAKCPKTKLIIHFYAQNHIYRRIRERLSILNERQILFHVWAIQHQPRP